MKNKMDWLSCRTVLVALVLGGLPALLGCRSATATASHPAMQTAKPFVHSPSYCPTPDGMTIARPVLEKPYRALVEVYEDLAKLA